MQTPTPTTATATANATVNITQGYPRRRTLRQLFGLSALFGSYCGGAAAGVLAELAADNMVTIENFGPDGQSRGIERMPKVIKSEAEWRADLSPQAYRITRQAETEQPYTGSFWNSHADGLYHCIACQTVLFDSRTKFESGTGWPSFWLPVSALNILRSADTSAGMRRNAVSCRRCDAHLGHVFGDGPAPSGLRYCINSAALTFVART